jgi:hypothetical protein
MPRSRKALCSSLALLALGACNAIFGVEPGTAETSTASSTGTGGAPATTSTTSGTGGMPTTSSTGTGGVDDTSQLLAAEGAPAGIPDGSTPFETDSVTLIRHPSTTSIVLASKDDGTGVLYVDDNLHIVVEPTVGSMTDQYYEFWAGFPCPAASTTLPPQGDGSGHSPPLDITFLFSPDTTSSQKVTLEFWHCAAHTPQSHTAFYLVQL